MTSKWHLQACRLQNKKDQPTNKYINLSCSHRMKWFAPNLLYHNAILLVIMMSHSPHLPSFISDSKPIHPGGHKTSVGGRHAPALLIAPRVCCFCAKKHHALPSFLIAVSDLFFPKLKICFQRLLSRIQIESSLIFCLLPCNGWLANIALRIF